MAAKLRTRVLLPWLETAGALEPLQPRGRHLQRPVGPQVRAADHSLYSTSSDSFASLAVGMRSSWRRMNAGLSSSLQRDASQICLLPMQVSTNCPPAFGRGCGARTQYYPSRPRPPGPTACQAHAWSRKPLHSGSGRAHHASSPSISTSSPSPSKSAQAVRR